VRAAREFADDSTALPEQLNELDPESVDFYDYTTAAWYVEPRETRRRSVVGAYVDYICSTEYVFTLAAPIVSGERSIGIAAADVRVSRIEALVLPKLQRFAGPAVLTNGAGRVIASNSAGLPGGAIVAAVGERASRELPWMLVTGVPPAG
jgi:hypothetical protein